MLARRPASRGNGLGISVRGYRSGFGLSLGFSELCLTWGQGARRQMRATTAAAAAARGIERIERRLERIGARVASIDDALQLRDRDAEPEDDQATDDGGGPGD